MNYLDELNQDYQSVMDTIRQADGDPSALGQYLAAAALTIWSKNKLYSENYAQALEIVLGKKPTMAQIRTAMDCIEATERAILVPDFFHTLIDYDNASKTSRVLQFLEQINLLLANMAMINGDFTIEEANALTDIIRELGSCAQNCGIIISADLIRNPIPTTPLKEDSYLKPNLSTADPDEQSIQPPEQQNDSDPTVDEAVGYDSISPESSAPNNKPADSGSDETLESLLNELDALVGLDEVKQDVHSLLNFIKVAKMRQKRGMKVPVISYHLVFTGNPGTGKTTVARLVAKLYYHMGILSSGQLVEADRSTLVAGYLGQTAIKTQEMIQKALGGVLFIDEAYSLANDAEQDSYGREAIETILKAMEDHRDELVVIVAGYDDLMHKFIESNPGLASRFNKYFHFPDYSGDEMFRIFHRFCSTNGYRVDRTLADELKIHFDKIYAERDKHFGNARTVRNLFEQSINNQANRLVMMNNPSNKDLEHLTLKDMPIRRGME